MNYSNYSEKHKRSISPILKKTSEGSKMIHHNKENYIKHLESQLEKVQAATIDYKKCEQRMRGIEQLIEDHDEKLKNLIKLIKLLQNFAETQEYENSKIVRHINTKMEELYHNELRNINHQLHETQYRLELLETIQQKEQQPIQVEFEKTINRKIEIMMDEIQQSALKVDFHKLEERIAKFELKPDTQIKIQDNQSQHNDKRVEQQLSEMRRLMEVLLKDQDILKNNVQNLHIGFNQYKVPALTQIQNQVRKSVVQQPEGESIIQPKILAKDDSKTSKNNKKQNSQSRSQSNKKLGDKINFKLNRTKTSKQILHQKK